MNSFELDTFLKEHTFYEKFILSNGLLASISEHFPTYLNISYNRYEL
jgi:hypothetical protein